MRADSTPNALAGDSVELLSITADIAGSNTVVITARGDVDQSTSPLLVTHLRERIHQAGPNLVVDLTHVRHFGAAGITALVHARTMAAAAGVDLVVVVSRVVLMSLGITRMESAFDLYSTLSDALGRPGLAGRRVLSV
ncbi:STAS domain-containing protein [Umezawaea sp. Da 62-37]|uniref:STAS domain-containing protein n=1 Tax=Umezawaea sp. Da 62-37 TaxID=3075927 RepID=UPI0028F6D3B3|nr:STAS domain-containing protein [Umezawaea sp. Da 62-37]WNV84779.1 STAS domain-containing protein [Umezawaea sp. Da 62-37]